MIDLSNTNGLANSLLQRASSLRTQASQLDNLTSVVGSTYAGADAEAYRNAVNAAKAELNAIAGELETLARQVRSSANAVHEAEAAAEAEEKHE